MQLCILLEVIYGSDFDDVITGVDANNGLVGADGDDQLLGGEGKDYLIELTRQAQLRLVCRFCFEREVLQTVLATLFSSLRLF